MLNRAPVAPYGFATVVAPDAAILAVVTVDFPCRLGDERHYVGGDTLLGPALELGLHPIAEHSEFPDPPPCRQPWNFTLPTPSRRAAVFGYRNIKLMAGDPPRINQTWWNRAVMAGGNCRLITTTGLLAQAMNNKLHPDTIHALGGNTLVGATIPVEF